MTTASETTQGSDASRWNQRYSEKTHRFGRSPSTFLVEATENLAPGRALILAMGEGRNALHLTEKGHSVTGVDVSAVAVARCQQEAVSRRLEMQGLVADLSDWSFRPQSFDLITKFYFLDLALFSPIVRTLTPGGHFVLETFSARHAEVSDFGPRNPGFLLDSRELRQELCGLEIVHWEDTITHLNEGRHQGPAGLIRLLARKPD